MVKPSANQKKKRKGGEKTLVYRIGWFYGKWRYIKVKTYDKAMRVLADKTAVCDRVSFRAIPDKK